MKLVKNIKKSAFTLMEISITLLIISILVLLTIPIINKQMQKSDEYAYFLAYKTVEKLGSQIVAFGDPSIVYSDNIKNNYRISYLKQSLNNLNNYINNSFTPQAYAQTLEFGSWSEYEYNLAKICFFNDYSNIGPSISQGGVVKSNNGLSSTETYSYTDVYLQWRDYISKVSGASEPRSLTDEYAQLNDEYKPTYNKMNDPCFVLFGDGYEDFSATDTVTYDSSSTSKKFTGGCIIAEQFVNGGLKNYNAKDFCENYLPSNCSKISTEWHTINTSNNNPEGNIQYNECILRFKYDNTSDDTKVSNYKKRITNSKYNCSNFGFIGFTYNFSRGCICENQIAINNPKVCCPSGSDARAYAVREENGEYECKTANCSINKFNTETNSCCPKNSKYSKSHKKCICDDGFISENNGRSCRQSSICQAGSHSDPNEGGECVANSPITSGKRFCELIVRDWNTSSSNCDTFTKHGDVYYNSDLLDNVTVGTHYLAINSKPGVFNNMEPNIVFSNGLKLWILGDKSSSIPGLTYTPVNYDGETNVCNLQTGVHTNDACKNLDSTAYFCSSENRCYTIKTDTGAQTYKALKDARNCCASLDITDIIDSFHGDGYLKDARAYAINGFTIFVDIDGNKGPGTLWRDVYPFYVSANGTVYPAYPLDAPKGSNALYTGGNSSYLTADVYYYGTDANGNRRKIYAYSSIPFAQAVCFSRSISAFSPYCLNLGNNIRGVNLGANDTMATFINSNNNPCYNNKCFMHIKNKLKFL